MAGAVSRKGDVVARVIGSTDAATLQGFVRGAVSTEVGLLATDAHASCTGLGKGCLHEFVRHGAKQRVAGAVRMQTIDGFWPLLKRGIMGIFHKASAKCLPLCVAELGFRCNNRSNRDIFGAAAARC